MATNERTVKYPLLTVEHWRERLEVCLPKNCTLTALATKLSQEDDYFEGVIGYSRLLNIVNGRGGLQPTARTVELLEQLRKDVAAPIESN